MFSLDDICQTVSICTVERMYNQWLLEAIAMYEFFALIHYKNLRTVIFVISVNKSGPTAQLSSELIRYFRKRDTVKVGSCTRSRLYAPFVEFFHKRKLFKTRLLRFVQSVIHG